MTVLVTVGIAAGTVWCAALLVHDHRHQRCRCYHPFRRRHGQPVTPTRAARLWVVDGDQ